MKHLQDRERRITIGITCYNAVDTIDRAIRGALRQNWPSIEVLVVDDCSQDGSWEMLTERYSQDKRVVLVRHDANAGYPSALNTIMAHASGEFVAIFDDDDDNDLDRLRAQHARLVDYESQSGADLVLCYSNRAVVEANHTEADHIALAIGRRAPEPNGRAVADFLFALDAEPEKVWGVFGSCTLMARLSTFRELAPFDPRFRRCAEWDMAVRAALVGAHFIAVDRPLVTQYKTVTSDKSGKVPLKYALLLREKHRQYFKTWPEYHASRMLARSNFYGSKGRLLPGRAFRVMAYLLAPRLIYPALRKHFIH